MPNIKKILDINKLINLNCIQSFMANIDKIDILNMLFLDMGFGKIRLI